MREVGAMRNPYIGIVGIRDTEDIVAVSQVVSGFSASHSERLVQFGVQVNGKVVDGLNIEGALSNLRLPFDLDHVRRIFEYSEQFIPNVLNVVHYSEKEKGKLSERMSAIFERTGLYANNLCRAVQLNGYLGEIDLRMIRLIKDRFPDLTIIMQIDEKMIGDFSDDNIERILSHLYYLENYIGYALIDASGGCGEPINIAKSVMLAQKIRKKIPSLAIGFAGGFNGENVNFIVSRIMKIFKDDNFSIDVESGLRNKLGKEYGEDVFDRKKVRLFFNQAVKAFKCEIR